MVIYNCSKGTETECLKQNYAFFSRNAQKLVPSVTVAIRDWIETDRKKRAAGFTLLRFASILQNYNLTFHANSGIVYIQGEGKQERAKRVEVFKNHPTIDRPPQNP